MYFYNVLEREREAEGWRRNNKNLTSRECLCQSSSVNQTDQDLRSQNKMEINFTETKMEDFLLWVLKQWPYLLHINLPILLIETHKKTKIYSLKSKIIFLFSDFYSFLNNTDVKNSSNYIELISSFTNSRRLVWGLVKVINQINLYLRVSNWICCIFIVLYASIISLGLTLNLITCVSCILNKVIKIKLCWKKVSYLIC